MDRVVVTGIGVVSPLGRDLSSLWRNLIQGVSGIKSIDEFKGLPVSIGGKAKGFDPTKHLSSREIRHLDRFSQMALIAGMDAIKDAGIDKGTYPDDRIGVLIGSGIGGVSTLETQIALFNSRGAKRVSPLTVPMCIINMASGEIARRIDAKGPGMGIATACASSGHSIAVALRLIQSGDADCMITGGGEACLTPFAIAAFASMRALSTRNDEPERASRPFDINRDGFILSEGGAVLVLEKESIAKARGAHIWAIVHGAGMSQDAYHMVAPDPDGVGAAIAMKSAIKDAGITPEQIDYINAHGTSTQLNDKTETLAIKKVFGEYAHRVHISSTKSMTGHLVGGAASLETAICILALDNGVIPPTINLEDPDPACDLDYTPKEAINADILYCINNSFGFGGQNVSLVIGKG
ncbi:MAG: beta-ketoacyl-ACP synthase II [Deltaproteobacteria bacterium]|nr:beta-ketoacyl-ACP synthase II [Deltaproteobacteria bacterium]